MTNRRFTTIISILGVILTFASVVASIAQYRAADLQAKAAIAALMPQLEVRAPLERVDSDQYTDRRLALTSDGGPIYNFSTDRLTTFSIKKHGKTFLEQPLFGYYAATFTTGRTKGELQVIVGHRNHSKMIELEQAVERQFPQGVAVAPVTTILRATYMDSLRAENLEYFLIMGGSVQRMTQQDGQLQWERMKSVHATTQSIDIDSITKPEMLQAWLASVSQLWAAAK